jgi:protein phosphatase
MREDLEDTAEFPEPPGGRGEPRPAAGASALVHVELAARTHPGRVREQNEDHFIVVRFDREMQTVLTNLPPGDVPEHYSETAFGLLVADGVGGAKGGEVASRIAIQALLDLVVETPDWIMRMDEPLAREVLERLERRFQRVRQVLVERAQADPSLRGMATTMTVAASLGRDLLTAHVGDSRAYLFRRDRLTRLTRDQTMAQSLADAGAIPPEEVATHPGRHVLTGALATRGAFAQVELGRTRLDDGDQILVCSDGLTEMVSEETIGRVLRASRSADEGCRELVELALDGGGRDNITAVLGRYRIPVAV